MAYDWEEVKRAVERVEDARLEQFFAEKEVDEGHITRTDSVLQRHRLYLEIVGAVVVAFHVAVITLSFNFILWNWLFHVNFER